MQILFCTGFSGNTIPKFINIKIIVITLIAKLKNHENIYNSTEILSMVVTSAIFVWHLDHAICQIDYDFCCAHF